MAFRTVLATSGPSRLARATGRLRRGSDGALVLDSGESELPVVILAAHSIFPEGPDLIADANGTPVVQDGDRVELVGGSSPTEPGFYASRVLVIDT